VIHHALWLINRFNLSLRTVKELLVQRSITVSHETLREWNIKFAGQIALEIKRRGAAPSKTCLDHKIHLLDPKTHLAGEIACGHGRWHLDEMHIVVQGKVRRLCLDHKTHLLDPKTHLAGGIACGHGRWRAVDEHGMVLDILLQDTRDTEAATRFFE
jgi:putative transposase